jgi:hypothetical protein
MKLPCGRVGVGRGILGVLANGDVFLFTRYERRDDKP